MVKTLGQIAYEATVGPGRFEWSDLVAHEREKWEAAAQAVREAVVEECARACEEEVDTSTIYYDEWLIGCNAGYKSSVALIRALKDKK